MQESLQLSLPSHHKTDEVSIMCLDCSPGDPSMFVVGTEEGSVYRAHRHDRAGVKAGLDIEVVDRHHSGPVTSLDIHPSTGSIDFSDIFLTTSVDWTIKLWRNQITDKPSAHNMPTRALHSFEGADDYVFDARWHPQHPAVFGSVDGTGRLNLWNLNKDTEVSQHGVLSADDPLIFFRCPSCRPKSRLERSTDWLGIDQQRYRVKSGSEGQTGDFMCTA